MRRLIITKRGNIRKPKDQKIGRLGKKITRFILIPIIFALMHPYVLCSADKLEKVLGDYSDLNICVPHLGADEFDAYRRMLLKYDNLWLDTTMTLADYLPMDYFPDLTEMRADRIIFGTDFPNLPYAWDREIRRLIELKLPDTVLERILGANALEFYGVNMKAETHYEKNNS